MNNAMVVERKQKPMKRADAEEIQQIMDRLEKLSQRPENPGVAYRNLDTIAALVHTLREKLEQEAAIKAAR
jgi:hypothetical protein